MTLPKLAGCEVRLLAKEGEVMTVDDTMHPPMASCEATAAQPSPGLGLAAPDAYDDQMEDGVAEALAFATRITARIRKPGDLTLIGVPRVA